MEINETPTDNQMQFQMHFANRPKAILCIASPDSESTGKIQTIEVAYDRDYFKNIRQNATKFWEKAIYPNLIK